MSCVEGMTGGTYNPWRAGEHRPLGCKDRGERGHETAVTASTRYFSLGQGLMRLRPYRRYTHTYIYIYVCTCLNVCVHSVVLTSMMF